MSWSAHCRLGTSLARVRGPRGIGSRGRRPRGYRCRIQPGPGMPCPVPGFSDAAVCSTAEGGEPPVHSAARPLLAPGRYRPQTPGQGRTRGDTVGQRGGEERAGVPALPPSLTHLPAGRSAGPQERGCHYPEGQEHHPEPAARAPAPAALRPLPPPAAAFPASGGGSRGRGRLGGRRGGGSPAPPVAVRPPRPTALINPRQLRLRPSRRSTSGTARPAGEPPGNPPGSAHRYTEAQILKCSPAASSALPAFAPEILRETTFLSVHPSPPPSLPASHTGQGLPEQLPSPGSHPQASIFPINPRQTATATVL